MQQLLHFHMLVLLFIGVLINIVTGEILPTTSCFPRSYYATMISQRRKDHSNCRRDAAYRLVAEPVARLYTAHPPTLAV
jgi:hypothetical protein